MAFRRILYVVLMVALSVDIVTAIKPQCSKCPSKWTLHNGNCYHVFLIGKTFAEAEKHCQEFTRVGQGHLASIGSALEHDLLFEMWKSVRGTTKVGMWIGLTDKAKEGKFVWTDGSSTNYAKWDNGQPDNYADREHCTHMMIDRSDGRWNDLNCNQVYSYMCKISPTE
ncbi:alpha-N-acetylgalactosamine-specific lectin-like [Patiria miniata]|uniref:C-type lectin domain-containing protein n=1 Tax=Patiria miniata TaxID=46514 RepID=A0A914AQZ8_PATMI|nr:alpha-N-acetylgalactosamine-specific lectin-like [Patiria miniata]